eukprot:Amastigsp_a351219_3.p3 type:complete len:101 gc:universal Amastigsp_a351219_3:1247-1549(+)
MNASTRSKPCNLRDIVEHAALKRRKRAAVHRQRIESHLAVILRGKDQRLTKDDRPRVVAATGTIVHQHLDAVRERQFAGRYRRGVKASAEAAVVRHQHQP